ncbi:MAG: hypothetical protein KH231_07720 [Dialister sp.]|uniref:hypothetical protein n=1 Tax=Dialister sp. TaxID=1955814 RepID=UPI001D6B96AA|nr:hypothetical protein [Dialister sp.]MBS6715336.1 hypothetical protein [Dialister sp.]
MAAQVGRRICTVCGKEFEKTSFMKPYDNICSFECFDKNFWNEYVREYNSEPELHCIINGTAYSVGKENVSSFNKGFDGRKFKIQKNSGQIIVTTNLRCNGDVPIEYRTYLPDDAEFIWGEE